MNRFSKPIDHVYIICNPEKEPERAAYLKTWFQSNNVDPTQYTFHMPYYGTDPLFQTREIWNQYDPWTTKHGRVVKNFNAYNLKPSEISLIMNFIAIAKKAVADKHSTVMILESDVIFHENFLSKLETAMSQLPAEWDFLSLSASAGLHPNNIESDKL